MDFEELKKSTSEKIGSFGETPVKDVGKILSIVQNSGVSEKDVIPLTQKIYISLFQERNLGDSNQARQSWVVASGNNFEDFMRNLINVSLNSEGILAIKGDRLRNNSNANELVRFLTLQASRRCTQTNTGVWPDSDIVLLTKTSSGELKVFALLNCKTSDHSRNDAVLFWALALRDKGIKYCLLTQDLDNRFVKGDSDPLVSNIRRKSEAYLDRIYSTNPKTEECSQVRKIDFNTTNGADPFLEDLRRWRSEIVSNFSVEAISEEALC